MQNHNTLVQNKQADSLPKGAQIFVLEEGTSDGSAKKALLVRVSTRIRDWYKTYGSRSYVPSLNIDEAE